MNKSHTVAAGGKDRWRYHPDRETVITEPHARPSLPVFSSDFIVHLGFGCSETDLVELLKRMETPSSTDDGRHYITTFGRVRVKLERHTEFISLTCLAESDIIRDDIYALLDELLESVEVEMIAMTQVAMCTSMDELEKKQNDNHTYYGGVMRGGMVVRSSLVPNNDGCLVYLVHPSDHTAEATGRRIQRLLEMETYRTMSLLGLPAARRAAERLTLLEAGVNQVVAQMNTDNSAEYHTLFDKVTLLSQDSNKLQADTRFRYSASRAYFDLAQQRLSSLDEKNDGELQTISGFVLARLEPGIATIESTSRRQSMLALDIDNALSLLRTRIDLELNRDNQALLKSMDARHKQQVLIAQTVEGLSTVAISYYTIGLLYYLIKGYSDWLPLSPGLLIAFLVPVVLLGVWMFLRSRRNRWEKENH